ncbi:hypothetical protein LTR36_009640 [Oleoguttula mirabilis]|uniref:RhoGAP-domain-containing protein n=1 Tax=Oleoguttula mirabilis TaxID=1507867 RepID=A0AAV9J6B0_9PEZI|nr:hypothetical protein LTR36_009640 [Oleoguttula mirabilis]
MSRTVADGDHSASSAHKRKPTRPVPSPLQESTSARSASDVSGPRSPRSPAAATPSFVSRAAYSLEQVPTAHPLPVDRVRAPNPGKKAPSNPELEAIRSAVTKDALREEAQKAASTGQSRNVSAPVLGAAPLLSPPTSPTMLSSSKAASRADPRLIDGRSIMPRNPSIDSTVSTVSSSTTASQHKPNGTGAYRVPQEGAGPQDVAALIASAGSAEAAVQKLLNDKNQAASHNAQLWRLVEKQRAMILGLNKDLEKSLKEKERYRRKLKDHLVQSQSAPVLPSAGQHGDALEVRDASESPALIAERTSEVGGPAMILSSLPDFSLDGRKVSDTSDVGSLRPSRSDTPQDAAILPSPGLPATPLSFSNGHTTPRELERAGALSYVAQSGSIASAAVAAQRMPTRTLPMSPKTNDTPSSPKSPGQLSTSLAATTRLSAPAQGLSSPKSATRKAPPAPLQLSPKPIANAMSNIVDASESEYEEDPDSARAEQMIRGRRKTREEDDREREATARQEEEYRSRSKKEKSSKSRPAHQAELPSDIPGTAAPQPAAVEPRLDSKTRAPAFQPTADPVTILRQRARSDAAGMLQKSSTAPSLMSPGLPMSPRPIDKPLNSPMPRAPNKVFNSIPMSPRAGMPAGLPLSPRAPRHAIPLPPQTPLTFASPHLARAEAYHQHAQSQQGFVADRHKPSPDPSLELERPSTSSDSNPKSPGEVYRGLVTEQYPDLLLPPNALPSIYVKTSSSRMKPSRQSYIAPKQSDESMVLTLAVHERSDSKQLWRLEKTLSALALLDGQIRSVCTFRDRLPDKMLFVGHAPARIDARRAAVDMYFDRMLDSVQDERAAKVVCKFLSTDAIGADGGDYFGASADVRPDTPVAKLRPQRAGYLTKRGKNFGGWKARYFVLDGPNLKYFEAPGGAHLGSIKLQNAQIGKQSATAAHASQEDEDNQFRHAFLILEPKKKDSTSLVRHVLCAESDDERDAWVEALLQYVDYKDEEEESYKGTQYVRPGPDIGGARSPRLQKSMNDLRPPSRQKESGHTVPDPLRTMHYNDTIPGDAPVIGPTGMQKTGTPSPPSDGSFAGAHEHAPSTHPNISAPTNLQVISNAGGWGMKVPPTPSAKDNGKDKKRGMFAAFRGRSSSDLAPGIGSPAFAPHEQRQMAGIRAVFGVPLAEAVQFAHPADAITELPAVVYRCIEYLTVKDAIAEEGIFRLSGSNILIKTLKDRFNTEGDVNLVADGTNYDINAVASLLKLYLRELPATILTRELHFDFLQCMEIHGKEKIVELNVLVNRLPRPNRALLQALSAFLLSIVNNADINKMNVRNVGIVFAPTLNVPAPLISSFVEDQGIIFGPPIDEAESPISATEIAAPALPTDLRSPRKQMFTDLPTPAYHQTTFQSFGGQHGGDTGMIPMQPSYANYQMAPRGEGGYGSLNDALRSPTVYNTASNGQPTPREVKAKRRESAMMMLNPGHAHAPQKKTSMSRLREEEGASF